jgi:ferritin
MLSTTLQDAVIEQIRNEISSAYLYLSMAAYCESKNLSGFAKWLRVQWQEELSHGIKLFDFVHDRGGRVVLRSLDTPQSEFKSPLDVFETVYAHEQKVTASINRLYDLAVKENDHATQVELQWFIKEQVEEEKNASEIVAMIKMLGEAGPALIMLDRQLGARGS